MIEIARNSDGVHFYLLEHAFELDKLGIGEFTYFKKHLGMSDYMANFRSWLKRPNVYLVVAVLEKSIVGWSMNESWSKPSTDGRPVFVLRAIEVSPQLASKGLGRTLFTLISRILPGHIITKPVNANAKNFFVSLSFILPAKNCPVGLADHPGYLLLDEGSKSGLSLERMHVTQDRTEQCRMKLFPGEYPASKGRTRSAIASDVKAGGLKKASVAPENTTDGTAGTDHTICEDRSSNEVSLVPDASTPVRLDLRGEFIGNQKMLSSCECGENMAGKFLQGGPKPGTAFICSSCGRERYFLPVRKAA
ncbi:GNAT family N-acetyltransferase [Methanolobus chelungpuianus]|uniref:N-acetyltransferase domain-containing protein n=1 Tax=Methanolobus chelungpuianus TaxID=502115 RepID=A0AAE3KZ38_9EURY|nr:GNAT family N-acetyltransferase [Methanolobus chelungpuianus]MCQ6963364.1 hypothetical protein [Methanolobus chelungpuianus]